ncbi:B-cell receptor CD22-like [Anguilla rostrata]|uniref:B-cell receptor CD22-like n=1 Tax=Anguilla rostrata TaxID=7938 RepID=UPI0030D5C54A
MPLPHPPKHVSVSVSSSGEIVEGSSVTLTCSSSDANPQVQKYTWYKNNIADSSWRDRPKRVSVLVSPSGEIAEGSAVTLTCSSYANPPVLRYTWYRNNFAVSQWGGSSYTFKSITLQDAGEYTCVAQNVIGIERSPPKRLDVRYPPKHVSVSVSSSGEIVEGSSVTLTCSSSDANPQVQKYTWYKNNIADSSWRDPPKNVSVSVSPSGVIVEGSSVTLTCSSSDANPQVQKYTWYKNNIADSSWRGSQQSYTINNIKSGDAGEYYCEAQNWIWATKSPPKRLNVQYPPKSVSVSVSSSGEIVERSSVTLTCSSSDANPPVQTYTWYKNNRADSSWRGSSYTIKSITLQDAGEYTCQAGNGIGTKTSPPKRLDVKYPPKSVSVSVSPSGEIVEGSSVTLTCSSDANPPVQKYTWYKKNDPAGVWQAGSGQSLNFSEFRSLNSGEYYCEAQNRLGAQNASALLVTVQGGQSLIAGAAVGVAAILALVFLGVVCLRRRKSTIETEGDRQGNKSPIYGNVSGMAMSHTGTQGTDRDDGEVPLYASVQPANTRNQERLLHSADQKSLPQCEEGVQYASIQFRPSSAAPRSPAPSVKEDCVLYSTLRHLDK